MSQQLATPEMNEMGHYGLRVLVNREATRLGIPHRLEGADSPLGDMLAMLVMIVSKQGAEIEALKAPPIPATAA